MHRLLSLLLWKNGFVKDLLREKAIRRERRQSACLLAGMGGFWVLVLTLNHFVHVLSAVYVAAR